MNSAPKNEEIEDIINLPYYPAFEQLDTVDNGVSIPVSDKIVIHDTQTLI